MNEQDILTAPRIVQALGTAETPNVESRKVIVRGDRSGVFYGHLESQDGQTVVLTDCRHIWYWAGAANTAEIANSGVSKPDECKIVAAVARIQILDTIEILDCTSAAVVSLDAVPQWSER